MSQATPNDNGGGDDDDDDDPSHPPILSILHRLRKSGIYPHALPLVRALIDEKGEGAGTDYFERVSLENEQKAVRQLVSSTLHHPW